MKLTDCTKADYKLAKSCDDRLSPLPASLHPLATPHHHQGPKLVESSMPGTHASVACHTPLDWLPDSLTGSRDNGDDDDDAPLALSEFLHC